MAANLDAKHNGGVRNIYSAVRFMVGIEVNPVSGQENIEKQLSDNTNTVSQGVMGESALILLVGFGALVQGVKDGCLETPQKVQNQSPGFEDPKLANHVYKLHKALYGLKQAPRACSIMTKRFEMSMMGELTFFFGLQVKQALEGTFISQTKYVKDILKKFGMEDAKPIKMPMPTNGHLDLDDNGKCVDQKVYRSMIGSLLYLCASRLDIMLSVCMCARFQAEPKECHLIAVKRILRYLVHTPNLGLWYPKGCGFELLGYSDSDYAGCKVDRKSTTGTCQFLGRSLVSWSSKKQNSIALSTAEAEYVAAGFCCAQLLWMRQTLKDFGYNFTKIPLLCDNESVIKIANNPVQHSRTKHIDIRHHFLRDHETKGDICLTHVRTESQLTDIFTKPLDEKRFCELRSFHFQIIEFSSILLNLGLTALCSVRPEVPVTPVRNFRGSGFCWPEVPVFLARNFWGRLGKEKVGDFYSESQIPIHSRRAGSIVIRDAPRSPSPAASESDDGGNEDELGSESNPLRLYKTRAVDPDPKRPRVNYLKNLLKCGKDRMVDWYNSVIMGRSHPVVEIKWLDWQYRSSKNNIVFNEYSWNEEVIGKFYSTAFFGTTKKGLDFVKWTIQGQQYRVSMAQFAAALGWSLLPKVGDATALPGRHALLLSRMRYNKPDFSIMKLIWSEIYETVCEPKRGCIYAPYIMKMIEAKTEICYFKDNQHKPFHPHAPTTSATPTTRVTRASTSAAPSSSAAPQRSESSSPIKKALRAIFCMCAKTAKKVKKIERRQKEDWIAAGKDVSDISDDEEFVDPFAAYETARDNASAEGPSGTSCFFNEESSHSEESSDDEESDAPTENVPTDPDEAVDAAGQDIDSPHSGDTEIIPSNGDNDEA
uniref:Polyprotein n=1 Tax=Oryza sativa subsp. japonica TaxID=39947 RepID=Q8W2U1_ORYSJ|nr:putative polyprotein [Oryza sativa Japonica Group]